MTSLTDSGNNFRDSAAKTYRQARDFIQRHRDRIGPILSITLLILTGVLLYLLATQAFKPYFNCAFLVGEGLKMGQLCSGVGVNFDILGTNFSFPILPALNAIDGPLEGLRKFLAWNIIILFALLSILLTYISIKIGGFARLLLTPEGRKIVMTNISIWLFYFVVFCALFYFSVVL